MPEELPLLDPPMLPGVLGLLVEDEEPVEPDEPLDEPPLIPELELEGLWLDELPPAALLWPASHSERESLPSWSLSSLSNSPEELDEDDVPPEAALGLEDELELGEDELPPAAEDGEDDLLLCDMDGEALEPLELDFDVSLA